MTDALADAAELHVQRSGPDDGDPVLLVHAGVSDGRGWAPVAERLAARGLRCVAPDLRGFGASPDPTTDFRHADDLAALLDAEFGCAPGWIVGWSFGGAVALELAVERPDLARGVVLACSVPFGIDRSDVVIEAWTREEALLEAGDVDGALRNDLQTWGAGPGRDVADLDPAVAAHMEEVARDLLDREVRVGGEALDGDRDAVARLGATGLEVLVLVAEHDTPCHETAAAALQAASPRVEVLRIAGAAHMAPMERPDEVTDAIAAFVARAMR